MMQSSLDSTVEENFVDLYVNMCKFHRPYLIEHLETLNLLTGTASPSQMIEA